MGIAAATGEVVIFVDDDVVFLPEFITAHIKRHGEVHHPRLVFGFRHRIIAKPDDLAFAMHQGVRPNDNRTELLGSRGERLRDCATPWSYAYGCNISVSRNSALRFFDDSFVGWGNEDIEFAYRLWRDGVEIICDPDATLLHLDRPTMADPYMNWERGLPADFEPVILNTLRFLKKYPDDETLASTLRGYLSGFCVEGERCVREPNADCVEEVISWGLAKLRHAS